MDTDRIIKAAKEIEENVAALKWFEEFGEFLKRENGVNVSVLPRVGAQHEGSIEARAVLEAYAELAMPDITADAIIACKNTIEIHREMIAREIEKTGGGGA